MRILIADDSKTTLALTMSALKKLGHIPIGAESGLEAIEKFQTEHPDLIILDVVMEGMNGFQCAEKIREIEQIHDWIPIIFLSAEIDDASIAKGINAGGDDYLTKPFSEITLAAKIKAMQRIVDMRKELYEVTKKLSLLSTTDSLTGINNRLQFNNKIKEEIAHAQRHRSVIALFFMDLDNFKNINDQLGHHIGDLVLKETAMRLKNCLRESDFIARLGGDEFAIISRDLDGPKAADAIATKMIDALKPTYNLDGNEIHVSTSIGIALYPEGGETPTILVQNADMAMYQAKRSGGSKYKYYTKELQEKSL